MLHVLLSLDLLNYTALVVSGSEVSCGKSVSLTDPAQLVQVSTVLTIEDATLLFFPAVYTCQSFNTRYPFFLMLYFIRVCIWC